MSSMDSAARPWARFAARLVAARLAAGLTQLALAESCGGRGNSWIVQLEAGTNALPRMDDVMTLARVLAVPPEWLLFGKSFEAGSDRRIALGVGGAHAVLAPRGRAAELKLYAGAWDQPDNIAISATRLLCSCAREDICAPAKGPRLFLLDQRGRRLVTRGYHTAHGEVLAANGDPAVDTRLYRVAGVCWPTSA